MFKTFVEGGSTQKINDQCIYGILNLTCPQFSEIKINAQACNNICIYFGFFKVKFYIFLPVCSLLLK